MARKVMLLEVMAKMSELVPSVASSRSSEGTTRAPVRKLLCMLMTSTWARERRWLLVMTRPTDPAASENTTNAITNSVKVNPLHDFNMVTRT